MSKMFFTNINMISDHVAISKDDDDQKRVQMFFSSGKSSCRRPDQLLASNCKDDNQITAHFIQCNGDVLSFLEVGWDDDGLNHTMATTMATTMAMSMSLANVFLQATVHPEFPMRSTSPQPSPPFPINIE